MKNLASKHFSPPFYIFYTICLLCTTTKRHHPHSSGCEDKSAAFKACGNIWLNEGYLLSLIHHPQLPTLTHHATLQVEPTPLPLRCTPGYCPTVVMSINNGSVFSKWRFLLIRQSRNKPGGQTLDVMELLNSGWGTGGFSVVSSRLGSSHYLFKNYIRQALTFIAFSPHFLIEIYDFNYGYMNCILSYCKENKLLMKRLISYVTWYKNISRMTFFQCYFAHRY